MARNASTYRCVQRRLDVFQRGHNRRNSLRDQGLRLVDQINREPVTTPTISDEERKHQEKLAKRRERDRAKRAEANNIVGRRMIASAQQARQMVQDGAVT